MPRRLGRFISRGVYANGERALFLYVCVCVAYFVVLGTFDTPLDRGGARCGRPLHTFGLLHSGSRTSWWSGNAHRLCVCTLSGRNMRFMHIDGLDTDKAIRRQGGSQTTAFGSLALRACLKHDCGVVKHAPSYHIL